MSRPHPSPSTDYRGTRIHFVTGRLAEFALRRVVAPLAEEVGFSYSIQVLPITVAALMTPRWIAKRLDIPPETDCVLLPGYCGEPLDDLSATGVRVEVGPRDLHMLAEYFGRPRCDDRVDEFDIEIIAEINHAPRLALRDLIEQAKQLRAAGADVIDVGCEPGGGWTGVETAVSALRDEGLRVSIDSLDASEIERAAAAGAELVLSVNSSNRSRAPDWGCPVVVIPDRPDDDVSLEESIEFLAQRNVPLRIDPILEPIGCGFAASLGRYLQVRRRYPDAEMMMGIGNLTEMTDCDSAAVNVLLLGFCQELGIRSVLTTQVINWARTSVQECDVARRLVHLAVARGMPPKHFDDRLVMLRDAKAAELDDSYIAQLATTIRDHHVRILADAAAIHMISASLHCYGCDPFQVFADFLEKYPRTLDASHAFYLGYEMAKATTALTLGKQYTQDEPLDWGLLTRPESSHRAAKSTKQATDE